MAKINHNWNFLNFDGESQDFDINFLWHPMVHPTDAERDILIEMPTNWINPDKIREIYGIPEPLTKVLMLLGILLIDDIPEAPGFVIAESSVELWLHKVKSMFN